MVVDSAGVSLVYTEHLRLPVVGFEGNLQYAVTKRVSVKALDGHESLVIVCHGNEPESFALLGLKVAYDLNTLDSSEWPEELP